MAEIQLLGLSHYPPFGGTDAAMAGILRAILADPDIPADAKDPAGWPEPMRAEWGDDQGVSSAPAHRAAFTDGLDRVRAELEEFDPDVILVWGDDQYENFKEDLIPPFSVLAFPDREVQPYATKPARDFPRFRDEPDDYTITIKGRPDIATWLVGELLDAGIDMSYAYRPLHDEQLPHAFLNTVLFLDHRRAGFEWPIICMPINCYGRRVIAAEGFWKPFGEELTLDPPSPPPWRLMELGSAVVRALQRRSERVSIIASSSWSHAFLTDHTWRLRPDIDADRALYRSMIDGDHERFATYTTEQIEHAGQHEVLNWFAFVGAARELAVTPSWSTFVETWIFNSNKVFAAWPPTLTQAQ